MKASTQYNDLFGQAAADISYATTKHNDLKEVAEFFNIDTKKYEVIGIDISGNRNFYVSFIAIDIERSADSNKYLVQIKTTNQTSFDKFFERFHLILLDKFKQDIFKKEIDEIIHVAE